MSGSHDVVVLFSGGVDSTVCAYLARSQGKRCFLLSLDYGQRHRRRELEAAYRIAQRLGCSRWVITVDGWASLLPGCLTDRNAVVPHAHYADPAQRATVVPSRNAAMLSLASGVATSLGAREVWFGAHAGDATIYPDCRPEFVSAFNVMLAVSESPTRVVAPLLGMAKRDVVALARELGVPLEECWSCYEGGMQPCGLCGACVERTEAERE